MSMSDNFTRITELTKAEALFKNVYSLVMIPVYQDKVNTVDGEDSVNLVIYEYVFIDKNDFSSDRRFSIRVGTYENSVVDLVFCYPSEHWKLGRDCATMLTLLGIDVYVFGNDYPKEPKQDRYRCAGFADEELCLFDPYYPPEILYVLGQNTYETLFGFRP